MKRSRIQYAKDEIITDLYTVGLEYMYADTNEEYIGPYHKYTTGEVFTEFNWKPNQSKKLITYQDINTTQFLYKTLKPDIKTSYESVSTYVPQPTDEDFKAGYFQRYFISKFNENVIIEIDLASYNKYLAAELDNNAYVVTKLTWHISGIPRTQSKDGITEVGVYEKNRNIVINAESTMPGISKKLTDYLEFYVGNLTDVVIPKDING